MRMIFIARNPHLATDMDFERKLYIIRKRAENEIRYGGRLKAVNFSMWLVFLISRSFIKACWRQTS